MAFVLREEGRFSVIPTVSRFSVAAYESKTRLILVKPWLDCQAYLATDNEKLEVRRIMENRRRSFNSLEGLTQVHG